MVDKLIPVLTVPAPPTDSGLHPLGVILVSGAWNLPLASAIPDLVDKIRAAAVDKWPSAAFAYNFKWFAGAGHYGHQWYDGTADIYTP